MASKLVTDRQKSSEVVLNAIEHQGGALQEGITARSVAESGAAVDVGGLLAQLSLSEALGEDPALETPPGRRGTRRRRVSMTSSWARGRASWGCTAPPP